MTQAAELRELHDEELENRLAEASQELFNLRFQHVTGQLDNYARLSEVRREVARVNTLLREREIIAAEAGERSGETVEAAPEVETADKKKRRARVLASRRRAEAEGPADPDQGPDTEQADKESNDG